MQKKYLLVLFLILKSPMHAMEEAAVIPPLTEVLKHGALMMGALYISHYLENLPTRHSILENAVQSGSLFIMHCMLCVTSKHEMSHLLHKAVRTEHAAMAQLLIQHGANVHSRCKKRGRTPLFRVRTKEMAECLIAAGASPNAVDKKHLKPVDVISRRPGISQELIDMINQYTTVQT